MLLVLALLHFAQTQTQCDLEHDYMIGDIAIPSVVDSEPMYADDYSKVLTDEEQQIEVHSRSKRAAVRDRSRIWPDNTVPYVIESDFNDYYKRLLRHAMDTWEAATCIRFIVHTTQQDYIHIRQGRRCCSYVGRQRRGAQKMSLDPGCMQHGILLHELGHVIGFWHEQNRPDRDDYIEVIKNYHHSVRYNFQKLNESQVDNYGVPYDYNSIMHYGRTFFSMDGKSTTLLPLKDDVEIGQRLRLSPLDVLQANKLYMCQNDCSWSYNASEAPGLIHSMNYPDPYPPKIDCISNIYTREGQVIRLNFELIDVEHHSDCSYDYLEVRDGELATSPVLGKFCGDLPPRNFTSSGPALWIKFHSDSSVSKSGFFAHYTAFDEADVPVTIVNPCYLKTCAHTCEVIKTVATCTCPLGFYLNDDGFSCRDYNECQYNNGGCSHICLNSQGSFSCSCPRGYNLGDNNSTCIDIDECSTRWSCSQVCVNTPGSYYCACKSGYRLLSDYVSCEDLDECTVQNGGCAHKCVNTPGTYRCTCRAGYTARNTSCVDINECDYDNGGCQHTCSNTDGGYDCGCYHGYQLDTARINCNDIDECKSSNGGCQHQCLNKPGSYSCQCNDGYRPEPDNTSQCQDIDECTETHTSCEGLCNNEVGSYSCSCGEHYTLDTNGYSCIENIQNELEAILQQVLYNDIDTNIISQYTSQSNYCNKMLITEPSIFESPLYPYNYPINSRCSWIIAAKPGEVINLTFLAFDLELHIRCRYDYLHVYDGVTEHDPFIADLCGVMKKQFTVSSKGPRMLLKFSSDFIVPRRGFSAIIDMSNDNCGGRFYTGSTNRLITWTAQNEKRCVWTLTTEPNRNILLNILTFHTLDSLSTGRKCEQADALEIYNTAEKTLIGRYCKSNPPPKLMTLEHSQVTLVLRVMSSQSIVFLHKSLRSRN